MGDERLKRVLYKLQNLPSISLPTDYPRQTGVNKHIESSVSLLKLAVYDEGDDLDEEAINNDHRPSLHM